MSLSPDLKQRIFASLADVPAPTRAQVRRARVGLFGCGVVCGLRVRWAFECGKLMVTVEAGVALDCRGDPIHVPQSQSISIDPSCGQKLPPKIWVVIRRTEKCCAPRAVSCSCDDEETPAVCTREQDGFEIRLVSALPFYPHANKDSTPKI